MHVQHVHVILGGLDGCEVQDSIDECNDFDVSDVYNRLDDGNVHDVHDGLDD
jgi:hypothetical protein